MSWLPDMVVMPRQKERKIPIHAEREVQSGNVGLFLSLDSVFYFFHFMATIVIAKLCL
jgi:hypothetical protein